MEEKMRERMGKSLGCVWESIRQPVRPRRLRQPVECRAPNRPIDPPASPTNLALGEDCGWFAGEAGVLNLGGSLSGRPGLPDSSVPVSLAGLTNGGSASGLSASCSRLGCAVPAYHPSPSRASEFLLRDAEGARSACQKLRAHTLTHGWMEPLGLEGHLQGLNVACDDAKLVPGCRPPSETGRDAPPGTGPQGPNRDQRCPCSLRGPKEKLHFQRT